MTTTTRGKRWLSGFFAAALSFSGGYVLAQVDPAGDPEAADEAIDDTDEVDDLPALNLTPEEMSARVKVLMDEMTKVQAKVDGLHDVARKEKDVIKLNCVADKLAQIRQLMSLATSAQVAIEEAIMRNDEDGRYGEYERLSIVHQQVMTLGAEAEACIGEDLTYQGPTEIKTVLPDDEEDLDPVTPDFDPIDPLPPASPIA